jgi:hypothetical protein
MGQGGKECLQNFGGNTYRNDQSGRYKWENNVAGIRKTGCAR